MFSIKEGRVAIVTGAGSGIARCCALRYAEQGVNVVGVDINEAAVKATCDEINSKNGGKAIYVVGDTGIKATAQNATKAAMDAWGRIDILLNVAGFPRDGMLHKLPEENWDEVLRVNLKGNFLMIQACLPHMREGKYGRIVCISSTAHYGNISQGNYSAAKAGVIGLDSTVALEGARYNITCNTICPGVVNTPALARDCPPQYLEPMLKNVPLGHRLGEPEDIAAGVMFFSSEEASYITGQVLDIDGGMEVGVHNRT